jgi:hypothetical protein
MTVYTLSERGQRGAERATSESQGPRWLSNSCFLPWPTYTLHRLSCAWRTSPQRSSCRSCNFMRDDIVLYHEVGEVSVLIGFSFRKRATGAYSSNRHRSDVVKRRLAASRGSGPCYTRAGERGCFRFAAVTPSPPALHGPSSMLSTSGLCARTERTIRRITPSPTPCMMRTHGRPRRLSRRRTHPPRRGVQWTCGRELDYAGARCGAPSCGCHRHHSSTRSSHAELQRTDKRLLACRQHVTAQVEHSERCPRQSLHESPGIPITTDVVLPPSQDERWAGDQSAQAPAACELQSATAMA